VAAPAPQGRRVLRPATPPPLIEDRSDNPANGLYVLLLAAVAAVYVASGKLGLDLAFATSSVTAIWAPTGIALAALLLGGYRLWPAITVGALLTNINTGVPFIGVCGITLGNTLEALAGAYLLREVANFRPALDRVVDVLALVAFGAIVSTTVSASIGVGSLLAASEIDASDIGSVWRTWWLGDMGGDLIVAPALLVLANLRAFRGVPGGALEGLALAGVTTGVSALVFTQSTNLLYVVFPLLIWAALRFWQPGAAGAGLIVAVVAVVFTAHDQGPFAANGLDDRLVLAQTYVAVGSLTGLVLAAVTTERFRAEQAVAEIAETLQESLLPTPLPEIPSVVSAAYFRPAGERYRVGGDFYDLFEAGDHSWAFVVGDVVGKGPRAAALTALARYTIREAAAHEGVPSRILGLLHGAVRRQSDDTEFCTAVYARLDVADGLATVTLASGGHPLPFLLRTNGEVELIGKTGTLLGADVEPTLVDRRIDLASGEVLLFYTDGLMDAYAPQRFVDDEDVEAVLRSCVGKPPAEVIAAVERELLTAPDVEPRDDVAMVALQVV
jgi:integral membrane sensor domain MASE1